MWITALLLILAHACIINGSVHDGMPIVTTTHGKVRGFHSTSYSGRIYSEFTSIPYAQPPIGDRRFKNPTPLKKWHGIWDANFTISCPQLEHKAETGGSYFGQEDCLYLNIYVPKEYPTDEGDLMDVICDIHGGGFNYGAGTFYSGPKYLMDRNVVFITFNYRLGPLGFLSTEDDVLPGNLGMKDQVAALKWIKRNIRYFGGNPNSVTLTGLSAGGASVHYHYLSPLSKGLFKNGISISGTAFCPWTMQENALQQTKTLAASLGCLQESTDELVECLRQRPAKQIVEHTRMFRPWLINPFSVYGLVVEKHGEDPFLPGHPYELLAKGEVQDLPWITSTVSHEGLYPAADFILQDHYLTELNEKWEEYLEHILHYEHTIPAELKTTVARKIKEHYLGDRPISYETYQEVIRILGDRLFIVDSEKAARLQSKVTTSPVYYYHFTHAGEEIPTFTVYYAYSEIRHGVCHGDDVAFVFNDPSATLKKLPETDENMKDILLGMWTSFAKTGIPNVGENVQWIPVSKEDKDPFNYLHITSPDGLITEQADELGYRTFWDSLQFQENENLFPTLVKDEL